MSTSDAASPRKTLSIKKSITLKPQPAKRPVPEAARSATQHAPRQETRGGKLFALDENMRRMQADMDQLGKSNVSTG